MMRQKSKLVLAATVLALLGATSVGATNGMYLTAYGAETAGRGGANLAISDRTLAINFNPAGIAQLGGNHLTVSLATLMPSMVSSNPANEPTSANDQIFPLPAIAYVRGTDTPWTIGVGLVAQGGMGARYEAFNSFFGTRDEIFSEVRFVTAVPTLAYAISDDMSVGVSLNVGYSDVAFRFFPETSFFNQADPQNSFFGVRMEPAGGFQYNVRAGFWWRPRPRFSIGLIYQTETESDFSSGKTELNFANQPFIQQKVGYSAEVEGFTFAAQAGIGVAFRPHRDWMVAVDLKRYLWDDAIDTVRVVARNPDVPGAPAEVVLPFVFDWKDQWVLAVGGDYRLNDRLTLRGGYNFGENPVPDETLTPLFPATTEHHVSAGASWVVANRVWEIALEHAFEKDQVNENIDPRVNPFGPGSAVDHSQWTLSLSVSWAWTRASVRANRNGGVR